MPTKFLFWLTKDFCHLNIKDPDIVEGICQYEGKMETREQKMRVNKGSNLAGCFWVDKIKREN